MNEECPSDIMYVKEFKKDEMIKRKQKVFDETKPIKFNKHEDLFRKNYKADQEEEFYENSDQEEDSFNK